MIIEMKTSCMKIVMFVLHASLQPTVKTPPPFPNPTPCGPNERA